jgi:hypothetical protein
MNKYFIYGLIAGFILVFLMSLVLMSSIIIAVYPLLLIIGIFILPYLVSCFIIWIYERKKKKKK